MIKTKLFDNRCDKLIDTMINDFLGEGNRKLIDIKLTSVEENQFTQCEYIVILVYEEGSTDKETIEILGDATKGIMERNKVYREVMKSSVDEIKYALYSNKSGDVKEHYLKNAERYITEALEESE